MIELTTEVGLLRRFVGDLERTAPRPTPSRPELSAHAAVDREAARLAWATRIADEYRSVAVFSELLRLLADLEAPFAATCAMHRLIGDELRHTQVTATVVDWLGGHADLAIDLADIGLPPIGGEGPAVRALHIIGRELVVGEEESIYALVAYRDATTDPAIRSVLETILVDEVRHAATGRALLALFDAGPLAAATVAARAALPALLDADRAALRDDYRAACGGPGRALGGSIEVRDLEQIWSRV